MPSPQTLWQLLNDMLVMTEDGTLRHIQPGSCAQLLEQPSPFSRFPSSHSSATIIPSPQRDAQPVSLQLGSS